MLRQKSSRVLKSTNQQIPRTKDPGPAETSFSVTTTLQRLYSLYCALRRCRVMVLNDVVVLSSSPREQLITTTPPHKIEAPMSSSPALPSPSKLMRKKRPTVTNNDRTATLPVNVNKGFATASSLLRNAYALSDYVPILRYRCNDQALVDQQPSLDKEIMDRDRSIMHSISEPSRIQLEAPPRQSYTARKETAVNGDGEKLAGVGKSSNHSITKETKVKRTRKTKESKEPNKHSNSRQTRIRKSKITKSSLGDTTLEKPSLGDSDTSKPSDFIRYLLDLEQRDQSASLRSIENRKLDEVVPGGTVCLKSKTSNALGVDPFDTIYFVESPLVVDNSTRKDNGNVNRGTFFVGHPFEGASAEAITIERSVNGESQSKRRRIEVRCTFQTMACLVSITEYFKVQSSNFRNIAAFKAYEKAQGAQEEAPNHY